MSRLCLLQAADLRVCASGRLDTVRPRGWSGSKLIGTPSLWAMDDFSELTGAALVVGGSGGIGRTVVRLLAQRGSDVALTWRESREAADHLGNEVGTYGGRVSAHQLDATDPEA